MERYQRYEMGGYINNRLFCIGVEVSVQLMSGGGYYRIPVPVVRAYKGRGTVASAGFCRGVWDSAVYLSDRFVYGELWMEPLSWEAEDGEISEGISDYVNDRDDHILCLEDDELFPWGISNELLS